jgi:hypothetical protein
MAKLDKLITYAYLCEECELPTNIPNEEFEHKIYRAQEILRMLIGDEFYQDFLTNYKANTLSSAYLTLQPYINQFVAWQTHEFWVIKANFKATRSGIRVHSEENSTVASDPAMAALIRDAKQQSQFYKNILVDYLGNHRDVYELYHACCHNNKTGNSFKISAVRNVQRQPDLYGLGGTYKRCKG